MTVAQFARIGLPYFGWKGGERIKQVKEAGMRVGLHDPFNLSEHLLRDVGLLDGHETAWRMIEPACSARDMIDRYR